MNQLIEKTVEIEGSDGKMFEVPRIMVVGNERFFPAQIINNLNDTRLHHGLFVTERATLLLKALLKERESTSEFNITEVDMTRLIDKLLKTDFWPNRVTTNSSYTRKNITVVLNGTENGSVYINGAVAKFSAKGSPAVTKALLVLAEAIRVDNASGEDDVA